MGRHSAPDDDGDEAAVAAPPAARPLPGRHTRRDLDEDADRQGGLDVIEHVLTRESSAGTGEDEDSTAKIKPIVDPILDEPVPAAATTIIPAVREEDAPDDAPEDAEPPAKKTKAKAAKEPKAAKPKRPEPRVSDRAVLRDDSAALARVIAAVVAPFVIYVVVLIVLGSLDLRSFLIWIWAPLITAGVVAGLILDLAHRAAAARAITAAEERASAGR